MEVSDFFCIFAISKSDQTLVGIFVLLLTYTPQIIMRTLVFIFMLFSFALSAQTDTTYCIQLFATKNPKLIEPKMVAAFYEPCKIEKSGEWYRILYVCEDYDEAVTYLHSWQRQHRKAFICAKETKVINELPYLVFSEN